MDHAAIVSLRKLAELAERSGVDRREIQRCVDTVFETLLAVDERRLEAIQLRKRVRKADAAYRAAGTEARVEKLAERFGRSRATVYALLSSERQTLPR